MRRRFPINGELVLSLGILALGIFVAIQTMAIDVSPGYARVGPRVFPWVVSFALIVLGLWLGREAFARNWVSEDSAETATSFDWPAFLWTGIGLVLHMTLIGRAGFIIAATALFVCVARAFGSRCTLRDAGIGLVLATVVFVGFSRGLGLELPAGMLEELL